MGVVFRIVLIYYSEKIMNHLDRTRQQQALARVDMLVEHAEKQHVKEKVARREVAKKAAVSLGSFVLGVGCSVRGWELASIGSFATSIWVGRRAVTGHYNIVQQLELEVNWTVTQVYNELNKLMPVESSQTMDE